MFSDDDLSVELDVETARQLHRCWQATQQRRSQLSLSAAQLNAGMFVTVYFVCFGGFSKNRSSHLLNDSILFLNQY